MSGMRNISIFPKVSGTWEYDNIHNYARVGNKSKNGKTIESRRRSLRTSMLSHVMLSISFHVCQDHK